MSAAHQFIERKLEIMDLVHIHDYTLTDFYLKPLVEVRDA